MAARSPRAGRTVRACARPSRSVGRLAVLRCRAAAGRLRQPAAAGAAARRRTRVTDVGRTAARPASRRPRCPATACAAVGLPAAARGGLRLRRAHRAGAPRREVARRAVLPDRSDDGVGLLLLRELRDAARARRARAPAGGRPLHRRRGRAVRALRARIPNVEVRLFNPLPSRGGSLPRGCCCRCTSSAASTTGCTTSCSSPTTASSVSGGRNIADEYFMRSTRPTSSTWTCSPAGRWCGEHVARLRPLLEQRARAPDRRRWSRRCRRAGRRAAALRRAAARRAARRAAARARRAGPRAAVGAQLDAGRLELHLGAARRCSSTTPTRSRAARPETRYARQRDRRRARACSARRARGHDRRRRTSFPARRGMAQMKARDATTACAVVIVTNSLGATDEPLVYAGYARYRDDMLQAGRGDLRDRAAAEPRSRAASATSASRSAGCTPSWR